MCRLYYEIVAIIRTISIEHLSSHKYTPSASCNNRYLLFIYINQRASTQLTYSEETEATSAPRWMDSDRRGLSWNLQWSFNRPEMTYFLLKTPSTPNSRITTLYIGSLDTFLHKGRNMVNTRIIIPSSEFNLMSCATHPTRIPKGQPIIQHTFTCFPNLTFDQVRASEQRGNNTYIYKSESPSHPFPTSHCPNKEIESQKQLPELKARFDTLGMKERASSFRFQNPFPNEERQKAHDNQNEMNFFWTDLGFWESRRDGDLEDPSVFVNSI